MAIPLPEEANARASLAMVAATLSRLLDLIKPVAKRRRRVMLSEPWPGGQGAAVFVLVPVS